MNRDTAQRLAAWDGRWSASSYRRLALTSNETLTTKGRSLGEHGRGRPKSREHAEKIQRSLHRTMARKFGPRWRTVRAKQAGAASHARKGLPGRPRTEAQKAAARQRRKDPLFYVAIGQLHRLRNAGRVSTTDLLLLEDQVRASTDAVKAVRRVVEQQPGPHPAYTLDEIRGFIARDVPAKGIAASLNVTVRRAQQLVRLVLELDQKRKIPPSLEPAAAKN